MISLAKSRGQRILFYGVKPCHFFFLIPQPSIVVYLRPKCKSENNKKEENIDYLSNLGLSKDFLHRKIKGLTIKIFLINQTIKLNHLFIKDILVFYEIICITLNMYYKFILKIHYKYTMKIYY